MSQEVDSLGPAASLVIVQVARRSLELYLQDNINYHPDLSDLPTELTELGCSFVTITNRGELRGCMGNTEARFALARDVARNSVSAAARDFRFRSVTADELPNVRLEVTVLTTPQNLPFLNYAHLLVALRPGVDGVILSSGVKKGLLLPQVWDRIQDPGQFLEMIALKAGIPAHELRDEPPTINAQVFKAHHYSEHGYREPGS